MNPGLNPCRQILARDNACLNYLGRTESGGNLPGPGKIVFIFQCLAVNYKGMA
jgi:hypothetical protein